MRESEALQRRLAGEEKHADELVDRLAKVIAALADDYRGGGDELLHEAVARVRAERDELRAQVRGAGDQVVVALQRLEVALGDHELSDAWGAVGHLEGALEPLLSEDQVKQIGPRGPGPG